MAKTSKKRETNKLLSWNWGNDDAASNAAVVYVKRNAGKFSTTTSTVQLLRIAALVISNIRRTQTWLRRVLLSHDDMLLRSVLQGKLFLLAAAWLIPGGAPFSQLNTGVKEAMVEIRLVRVAGQGKQLFLSTDLLKHGVQHCNFIRENYDWLPDWCSSVNLCFWVFQNCQPQQLCSSIHPSGMSSDYQYTQWLGFK